MALFRAFLCCGEKSSKTIATPFTSNTVAQEQGKPTMSDLMLDVDQAGELKAAFRRGNWTNAEIKKACEGVFLTNVRQVLLGHAEIKQVLHVIDCDADPFVPNDWKVEEHKKCGQFVWDPTKVELYLSEGQKGGKNIEGFSLRNELENKQVWNANLLDYLLKNPHLIPEEWKGDERGISYSIFFWGTVYRFADGGLCVRCLNWNGEFWCSPYNWLGYVWPGRCPAACRVS